MVALTLATAQPSFARQAPDQDELVGQANLAARMAQLAKEAVYKRPLVPATLQQSAALLEAAAALDAQPRYYRLLAENYAALHEPDKQISALSTYCRIPAKASNAASATSEGSADQHAIVQLMDLYLSQMQSLDGKLDYTKRWTDNAKLADEVRAHAAFAACQMQNERMDTAAAGKLLDRALQLNPLCVEALQYRYSQLLDGGTPAEITGAMVDLLKANPVQPAVMGELADELARQGLFDLANNWYDNTFDLQNKLNQQKSPDLFLRYACSLLTTQQIDLADQACQGLIKSDPTNTQAAFLGLLISRQRNDPTAITAAQAALADAMAQRLSMLHSQVVRREPSTRPVADESNDIPADLAKLKASGNEALFMSYVGTAEDLAWYEIYFGGKSAAAQPLIEALRQVLPADDVAIARLEGFALWADKKYDAASVKLSAVQDRDPLSHMGMLLMRQAKLMAASTGKGGESSTQPAELTTEASALVIANQGGLLGLLLADGLHSLNAEQGATASTESVRAQIERFPHRWLDIIDPLKSEDFYNLKIEPAMGVKYAIGSPMLVRVTIQCTTEIPITVGENCTLRPDLIFESSTRGLMSLVYPQVYDRIAGPLVLRKGELGVCQIVRVDDPAIDDILSKNPIVAIPLYFSCYTNPLTMPSRPGPAGYRRAFTEVIERGANPIAGAVDLAPIQRRLLQGTSEERFSAVDLFANLVLYGRATLASMSGDAAQPSAPDATPAAAPGAAAPAGADANAGTDSGPPPDPKMQLYKAALEQYSLWVRSGERGRSPTVRAWAGYCAGLLAEGPDKLLTIKKLIEQDTWEARVLATVLLRSIPADQAKPIARQLADEAAKHIAANATADEHWQIVQNAAEAALGVADVATTQPATQPATQPST